MKSSGLILLVALLMGTCSSAALPSYQYQRLGNPQDIQTRPTVGLAMMGGGKIWMRHSDGSVAKAMAATFLFCGRQVTTPTTLMYKVCAR